MASTRVRTSVSGRAAVLAGTAAAALLSSAILAATPRPSALLIRCFFQAGARATLREMQPHVPTSGVIERLDRPVTERIEGSTFDVFAPADTTGPRPTVV